MSARTRPSDARRAFRRSALLAGVAVALSVGCAESSSLTPDDPDLPGGTGGAVPALLELVSGAGQVGGVGEALASPLTVRLSDAAGAAMANWPVAWSVVSGGGVLSEAADRTDAEGRASASWRLGTVAGVQELRATVAGIDPVSVRVTAEPGPLAGLSIDPATETLEVGETLQLSAAGVDAYGNEVGLTAVNWSSSAEGVVSVAADGMATAGSVGQAAVEAEQGGLAAVANLTVQAPSGRAVLFEEPFEDDGFAGRGWYDNTGLITTAAESYSGDRSLEVHFASGAQLPNSGGAARILFEESESVYVRYWVKYSDNWVGSGVGYHPHDFQIVTNQDDPYVGPAYTHLTAYIETHYEGGIRPVLGMRDRRNIDAANAGNDLTGVTENRAAAGCNGNTDGYSTGCWNAGGSWWNEKFWTAEQPAFSDESGPRYKGDWHLVEVYFELNEIENGVGLANGIAQYWLDGELVMDLQGVLFRTGAHPNMRFNQFLIAPYIGVGSPRAQTMWIDELQVADRR